MICSLSAPLGNQDVDEDEDEFERSFLPLISLIFAEVGWFQIRSTPIRVICGHKVFPPISLIFAKVKWFSNKICAHLRNLRAQGSPANLADFRRSWVILNKIYTYPRNLRAQGFPANLADFRGSSSFQKVICVYPRPSAGNIFPAFSASSLSPLRETHIGWEAQYKVCKESNLIGFAVFT